MMRLDWSFLTHIRCRGMEESARIIQRLKLDQLRRSRLRGLCTPMFIHLFFACARSISLLDGAHNICIAKLLAPSKIALNALIKMWILVLKNCTELQLAAKTCRSPCPFISAQTTRAILIRKTTIVEIAPINTVVRGPHLSYSCTHVLHGRVTRFFFWLANSSPVLLRIRSVDEESSNPVLVSIDEKDSVV